MAVDTSGAPPGVLRLPDIAYERARIEAPMNGSLFVAEAWVNGPGCPGRIKAEYARKLRQFAQGFLDAPEAQEAAYYEFLADALGVIFGKPPGEDLDLLAGDTKRAEAILIHCKWREADDAEVTADPEASGGDGISTTGRSSPTSVRPTPRPRTGAAGSTSRRA